VFYDVQARLSQSVMAADLSATIPVVEDLTAADFREAVVRTPDMGPRRMPPPGSARRLRHDRLRRGAQARREHV